MLSLLLIATIINYIDRVNISIAAPFMAKDLGLDKIEMGLIFSGVCLDLRARPGAGRVHRRSLRFPVHLRGVADQLVDGHRVPRLCHWACASLFGLRLAVGAMEAPAFPANSRAVTVWFPARERGLASSIYVCGQYLGTALFTGALLWLATTYDWRHVFYSTGDTRHCLRCDLALSCIAIR